MHDFLVFLFAIACGMTASGLVANVYCLVASEPKTRLGSVVQCAVMVVAGPVMLVSNSTKSLRAKECSKAAYALALALSGYWSFAMGTFFLSLVLALQSLA
jgi:hypothetical protein